MGLLFYGLASKAYSHPWIRLKKYPIGGWLVTGFFQGFFTFILCYTGINDFGLENVWQGKVLFPAILTSIMLWGNYPMTQVYQHEEDASHGDLTLSRMLGIRGTFCFVMIVFSLAIAGFTAYFTYYHSPYFGYIFLIALSPVALFFLLWFYKVWHNPSTANFTRAMLLNFISATCLNGFFLYFFFAVSHVGQYL
jgi:1,4-dihydroxy-2-naphthoate octaprenyltransferase